MVPVSLAPVSISNQPQSGSVFGKKYFPDITKEELKEKAERMNIKCCLKWNEMGKKRIRTWELVCQAQYGSKKGSRGKTIIPDSVS